MASNENIYPATFRKADIDMTDFAHSPIKTWPQLIEFNAQHNPHHIFCMQARSNENNDFLTITYNELRHAVVMCSRWLVENVTGLQLPVRQEDNSYKKGRPVAVLAESDLTLMLYMMASISLGVPVGANIGPLATVAE